MSASDAALSLGGRMKQYEAHTRLVLPARRYTVVRVDGHAFHTYTRGLDRPFDAQLAADMDAVGVALAEMIPGAVFAYVASDEASVVLGPGSEVAEPWFGGVVAKITSLTAALATATLAQRRPANQFGQALFDSRVFTVPSAVEAANYLVWRQRDTRRNSVSMAAQAVFPHERLQGLNGEEMLRMLGEAGANWHEHPEGFKAGRVVIRRASTEPVEWTHTVTGAVHTDMATRSRWVAEPAPQFNADPDGWLIAEVLAAMAEREPAAS